MLRDMRVTSSGSRTGRRFCSQRRALIYVHAPKHPSRNRVELAIPVTYESTS